MKISIFEKVFLTLIVLLMSLVVCSASNVGIRIGINEQTIQKLQRKYFPQLLETIREIQVPDQEFSYSTSLAATVIKLSKIHVSIEKLSSNNIAITFEGNSGIKLKASHITSFGSLLASANVGYLPTVQSEVQIEVSELNVEIMTEVDWQPHPSQKGKHTATLKVTDLKVEIVFDFRLMNTLLNAVKNYFDQQIKASVNDYLKTSLKDTLLPILNERSKQFSESMPVYVSLHNNILIDYSLIEKPIITNKILILNVDGKIVHKGDPNDKAGLPLYANRLPQITQITKGVKALISTYTINTMLYTLYHASLLKYNYYVPDIVEFVPKQDSLFGGLHPVNHIRSSLKSTFGTNRKGLFEFEFSETPQVTFSNRKLSSSLKMRIAFSAENKLGKYELFSGYQVEMKFEEHLTVTEGGYLNAPIDKFEIISFHTLSSILGGDFKEEKVTRGFLNYIVNNWKDNLNEWYLINIKFPMPSIGGLSFLDSTALVNDDHLELEWNVTFDSKRRLKKKRFLK